MQKIEKALHVAVAHMMFSTFGDSSDKAEHMQAIHEAHDEIKVIKELLKSIEFIGRYNYNYCYGDSCPDCGGYEQDGHKPDCQLAKLISNKGVSVGE